MNTYFAMKGANTYKIHSVPHKSLYCIHMCLFEHIYHHSGIFLYIYPLRSDGLGTLVDNYRPQAMYSCPRSYIVGNRVQFCSIDPYTPRDIDIFYHDCTSHDLRISYHILGQDLQKYQMKYDG